jgi:hypothetical protein
VDILFRAAAINTYTDKMFAYGGLPPNFPPPAEQLGQPAAAGFQPAASAASAGQAGTLTTAFGTPLTDSSIARNFGY